MLKWIQRFRRRKILKRPFPAEWMAFVDRNVPHFKRLKADERTRLLKLTQIFIAEKNWEACGGLVMNDEIRVTIASQACLLVLNLPNDLYGRVNSILVYPTTIVTPGQKSAVFEPQPGLHSGPMPILGQAQLRGPVILVWDSVLSSARLSRSGHNIVYHEFAHKLDMFSGRADGTPPLRSKEQLQNWIQICSREFLHLRKLTDSGKPTFLNSYGTVNEAEFFAVITEQFFDQPEAMQKHHGDLYSLLSEFYRQDPAGTES